MSTRKGTRERLRAYGPQTVVIIILWTYFVATSLTFRGTAAVYPVIQGLALVGLVALGIAITMIVGELDLSVASMATVAGVVAVHFSSHGLFVAVITAVIAGAAVGLVQGILIARLDLNSLVLTIGSLVLLRGIALVLTHGKPLNVQDFTVGDPLLHRWSVFSLPSLLALAIFGITGGLLTYTRRGREIYATGGARTEARAAGVPTGRAIITAFIASSVLASLAGAMASLQGGTADPNNFPDLLLTAASAALIGGIAMTGGRGTVLNVALGVLLVSLLSAGFADKGYQGYITQLATGGILLAVIGLEYGARQLREARHIAALRQQALLSHGMTAVEGRAG